MPAVYRGRPGVSSSEQRRALRDAAQWHARLGATPGCKSIQQQWIDWHQESDANRWAWQHLERLQKVFQGVPGTIARSTLTLETAQPRRRTVLKGLLIGAGVSSSAWLGYREAPVWLADQRTRTGERRSLTLSDGTLVTLNTSTAVDILFKADQRLILLREGEILVQTGKDTRPFKVQSAQGEMRALGTRFSVRQHAHSTELNVFEHTVAVSNKAGGTELPVGAGMRLYFGDGPLPTPTLVDPNQIEWVRNRLVIDNWPLDRVLAELQRYRPGFIECSPQLKELRLSGSFPVDDTGQAFVAIARVLPVKFETLTRYWVRVMPIG